jgi:hypothetical protein
MPEAFKLPGSSYDEVVKIIKAYSTGKDNSPKSLDDIASATVMPRTIVSGNNGFLVQIGLISNDGNKKSSTDIGRNLGRAYTSNIVDKIKSIWRSVIEESDFLTKMVSAVRIRNGMDRISLVNHIVYSSGLNNTKANKTGAGAIIEILKVADIFEETDGNLVINEASSTDTVQQSTHSSSEATIDPIEKEVVTYAHIADSVDPQVIINININCTPNDIDSIKEKLSDLICSIKLFDDRMIGWNIIWC